MTRSNRRKNYKRVKKLISKNITKKKITKLHLQLLDKEYYLSSILDFMKGYYHSPWDRAVYTGFRNMCFMIVINSFLSKKVTRKNPPKKTLRNFSYFQLFWIKRILSYFPFLTFMNFFLEIFFIPLGTKTVYRGYQKLCYGNDKKKKVFYLIFLSRFTYIKNVFSSYPRKNLTPALTTVSHPFRRKSCF